MGLDADMTPLLTALIIGLAAAGIFALRPVIAKIKITIHTIFFIQSLLYQIPIY